jgi:hypothetical protein
MNRLDTATRARMISCLIEGCSLRSTCRMTGVAMNTVLKLLADLGAACNEYQDKKLRGLTVKRVQCDEIWSFCYAKERNVSAAPSPSGRLAPSRRTKGHAQAIHS